MSDTDFYEVLGILPSAEDIVVTAAYRALSSKYHPDRWSGDAKHAHDKMSEINEAYSVLRDHARRADYDRIHQGGNYSGFTSINDDELGAAFDVELGSLENSWSTACGIYPDLADLRGELRRISPTLAFSFVLTMLESKKFSQRTEVSRQLEKAYFSRYFGGSPLIKDYAKFLLLAGRIDAARELNRTLDVLGNNISPKTIVSKINKDFGVDEAWDKQRKTEFIRNSLYFLVRVLVAIGLISLFVVFGS